jgi:redox-sensitive bicupin YhaK (pirin superfamily)
MPLPSETVVQSRTLERLVAGKATSDGAGVKLTRVLTHDLQQRLDPFLMLDAFCNENPDDYMGGFPDHPHRGFETVTYMLAGRMRHHDSAGNSGLLEPGGAQWMTAGSGLIHSELPEQEDGLMEGFQLWLNLPARHKMAAPYYRDIPAAAIPEFDTDAGVHVRVIAGSSHGVTGAMTRPDTTPLFLDVHVPARAHFEQTLPPAHNAFLYVYRGRVQVQGDEVRGKMMGVLSNADSDGVRIDASEDARFILIAGAPLHEPIVQYGPFVMNSAEEIHQAIRDYQSGAFQAARVKALQG